MCVSNAVLYNTFLLLTPSLRNMMLRYTEPEFVNLLMSPGIDSQPVEIDSWAPQRLQIWAQFYHLGTHTPKTCQKYLSET
jgi:hypothetical protein